MSVYVDNLFATARSRQWPYTEACHLTADTTDELMQFAAQLGLRPNWLQRSSVLGILHFDLTRNKRLLALKRGAKEGMAFWPPREREAKP